MKAQTKTTALLIVLLVFSCSCCFGQLDGIMKAGGKLLEKSPSKLMEKYFSNAPVTTSFENAKTEVMLLGNFDPEDSLFLPLSNLDQNENGDYIVTEGLYSAINKSFCLRAGTHGPSQGDGHLYAPLIGPKAFLVKSLLENWLTKGPDIPQGDVQCLIWAIIARTDIEDMLPKYKLVLTRLLDKDDIAKLAAGSLKDKTLEASMEKFRDKIPPETYKVFEAERNLRSMYSKADATYEEFETYAVLAGIAPASDMIRPVSKARWSYHPNGYFIRLTPHGYSRTKVDVYIPLHVTAETDVLGRIQSLTYGGDKVIEFSYDNDARASENIFSSNITEIKFLDQLTKKSVKLQGDNHFNFVKNDFSFAKPGAAGTKLWEFVNWLNAEKGSLSINLDQGTKSELFNLSNAIHAFEDMPGNAMDPMLNSFTRYLLNEAYNYSVYKNLSINDGSTGLKSKEINNDQELLVVTNLAAGRSGPQINNNTVENNFIENGSATGGWYNQDRGDLDLPRNVATPANRSSQRIGQSKPPKGKPWYEKLPPCPCTYKEAQDSANKKGSSWLDCGKANQDFHYGSSTEVRWAPPKAGMSGQQCTYDKNGNLITGGIAAGSPDKVSPHGCGATSINLNSIQSFWGHKTNDMDTWATLPCWQYLRDWPANNANHCSPSNPVSDIQHMRDLVGDMNCSDITKILQQAANSKNISQKLRDYLQGKSTGLSNQELIDELNKWAANEGCPGPGICDLINHLIKNLQKGK